MHLGQRGARSCMPNDLTVPSSGAEPVDADLDAYLRANNVIQAINANLPQGVKQLPKVPKAYVFKKRDRETVSVALHSAFELIGGLPAFIQWGANNPEKFYAMWSKLAQSDTETGVGGTTINFVSAIPTNPLDNVTVDPSGKVITLNGATAADELPE